VTQSSIDDKDGGIKSPCAINLHVHVLNPVYLRAHACAMCASRKTYKEYFLHVGQSISLVWKNDILIWKSDQNCLSTV